MKKDQGKIRNTAQSRQLDQDLMGFQGSYSFLSNDYPSWTYFQGDLYPSVTTAYQAARTNNRQIRKKIANTKDIKQFSQICLSIKNPEDWSSKKYQVMQLLVRDKFKRSKDLTGKLMNTKNRKLINVFKKQGYNELYWGMVNKKGNNMLGKILMDIRKQISQGIDTKMWIKQSLDLQSNTNLWPEASLIVEKDGKKIDKLYLQKKNYFIFGSTKNSDFVLQNPTISRMHACIYFSSDIQMMIVDLNSTHGSYLIKKTNKAQNKLQIQSMIPYALQKGDVLQFGTSTRFYMVDQLNCEQVEKYIAATQANLQKQLEQAQQANKLLQNYDQINKQDIKNALGISYPCILVQKLENGLSYPKIRQYFEKYGKVKQVRMKVDNKNGKFLGTAAILFQDHKASQAAYKQSEKYKIKIISIQEAEKYLNSKDHKDNKRSKQHERRNRSKSRQKNSRSRSREKLNEN